MADLSHLRSIAACFDLSEPAERSRSALELARFYLELVTEIRPTVIAEIGAFEATFSIEMKRRLPEAAAIAFEANPYNFELHHQHAREAGVEYLHAAVADIDGATTFNVQAVYRDQVLDRVKGNDSLLTRTMEHMAYEPVTVPATTANRFFDQPRFAQSRMCLWIDVEGAAGKLLPAASEVFDRIDAIMIELENFPYWSGQWLSGAVDGFLSGKGFMPIARDFEYEHQFNVVYIKPTVSQLSRFDYLLSDFHSRIGRPRPPS